MAFVMFELCLQLDDLFTQGEVLSEKAGLFGLKGADPDGLGRVVPATLDIRMCRRIKDVLEPYFASSRFCLMNRRLTVALVSGGCSGPAGCKHTLIDGFLRRRGLVESRHGRKVRCEKVDVPARRRRGWRSRGGRGAR